MKSQNVTDQRQNSDRKIIHIDMDAFFASVEQRDFPAHRGKPLVVGGRGKRSVIAAASYEARTYGVHSAMPTAQALKLCPHLLIVPHRFDVYKKVSSQIRAIFFEYTDLVEPLSLDEAFLDVTNAKTNDTSAIFIAQMIKYKIQKETQLTASAGISSGKFVAKIASGMNKPNGLTVILPEEVPDFIAALPIEKFFGIGQSTAKKMHHHKIFHGKDLLDFSEIDLVQKFGKMGRNYFNISRGIDNKQVKPNRERKSISSETTFAEDLNDVMQIMEVFEKLSKEVEKALLKLKKKAQTVQIKIRYAGFETLTRQKTSTRYLQTSEDILKFIHDILDQEALLEKPVRLLGVGVSKFEKPDTSGQLKLKF